MNWHIRLFCFGMVVLGLERVASADEKDKGKTQIVIGQPKFEKTGKKITVTIVVSNEVDADVEKWHGEGGILVDVDTKKQVIVRSTGIVDGPVEPGKGPKKVTYTFDLEKGQEVEFTTRMKITPAKGAADQIKSETTRIKLPKD